MDIRVLHCYGDYKWTGPSEPVVALVRELSRRGLRTELACAGMTARGNPALARRARQAGLVVHDRFWFESSPNVRKNLRDVQSLMRLVRDGVIVYEGTIESLRRFKEDVKQVKSGYECGIALEDFTDVKEGDVIEAYKKVEVARE